MRTFWLLLASPLLAQSPGVDDFAWLAGCWAGGGANGTYEEQWMKPVGGMMLGMSRTLANGRTVAYEFLSIEMIGGKPAYVARPSGQNQTAFGLVKASAAEAVFENPAHDFPQRILYRRTAGDLTARVESLDGKRAQDFPMKSVACP